MFNNAVLSIDGGHPLLINEVRVGGREKVNLMIKTQQTSELRPEAEV